MSFDMGVSLKVGEVLIDLVMQTYLTKPNQFAGTIRPIDMPDRFSLICA